MIARASHDGRSGLVGRARLTVGRSQTAAACRWDVGQPSARRPARAPTGPTVSGEDDQVIQVRA